MVKDFDDKEVQQPLQTVVESVSSVDTRYQEKAARPVEEDFPVGIKVFFLGKKPIYGGTGVVTGHDSNRTNLNIAVRLSLSSKWSSS